MSPATGRIPCSVTERDREHRAQTDLALEQANEAFRVLMWSSWKQWRVKRKLLPSRVWNQNRTPIKLTVQMTLNSRLGPCHHTCHFQRTSTSLQYNARGSSRYLRKTSGKADHTASALPQNPQGSEGKSEEVGLLWCPTYSPGPPDTPTDQSLRFAQRVSISPHPSPIYREIVDP